MWCVALLVAGPGFEPGFSEHESGDVPGWSTPRGVVYQGSSVGRGFDRVEGVYPGQPASNRQNRGFDRVEGVYPGQPASNRQNRGFDRVEGVYPGQPGLNGYLFKGFPGSCTVL